MPNVVWNDPRLAEIWADELTEWLSRHAGVRDVELGVPVRIWPYLGFIFI